MSKEEIKKKRALIPKNKYQELKKSKELEVSEELILDMLKHKLYYMLSNAYHRTKTREEYKDVKYRLGEYKDGYLNLITSRPDLHQKLWNIIKEYIKSGYSSDYAPSIHRTKQHYEWSTIDILTVKEHIQLDNAVRTILFAVDDKGQIRLGIYNSQTQAQNEIGINHNTLKQIQKGDYEYQQEDTKGSTETLTFLHLEPINEPVPKRTIEEQRESDKHTYQFTVKRIEFFKGLQKKEHTEEREEHLKKLEKILALYEDNGWHLL